MFVAATAEESVAGCHSDGSGARSVPYRPIELEATEAPEVQVAVKSGGPDSCAATYMNRHNLVQRARATIAKYFDIPPALCANIP